MKKIIVALVIFLFTASSASALEIGIMSDIHAGKQKSERTSSAYKMYPRKYKRCVTHALQQLKSKGASTVIVTGDISNGSGIKYYKNVKRIADQQGMDMVWVRGNHDTSKKMRALTPENHYFVDRANIRIIVLDTNNGKDKIEGTIDQAQLDWFRSALQTDKQVVVAMHHPVFSRVNKQVYEQFQPLVDIIDQHQQKVRFVVAGHWHLDYQTQRGNTQFIVQPPLCSTNINFQTISL